MAQESTSRIILALRDGTVVKGSINLKVYSPMGRLSDGLNKAEDFLVLTDVEFIHPPEHYPEIVTRTEAFFVNRKQIIWASPLD